MMRRYPVRRSSQTSRDFITPEKVAVQPAIRSGLNRNFFLLARAEVSELHPDLVFIANFDLELVEAARAGAFPIRDGAVNREAAVMAGAMISFPGRVVIDETAGVRTH